MPSYAHPEMLEEMSRQADVALERVAERMARSTAANMLHLDPAAADPFGGRDQLHAQLKASYAVSVMVPFAS